MANQEIRRTSSLTDVDNILVGHHTSSERPTGCTVITSESPFVAGVDVRGGAPGTRETDLLRPENVVQEINAIVLSGGSAYGLDAATGVVRFLEEKGIGFAVGTNRVPIVPGAILYDLNLGAAAVRPDATSGFAAASAATRAPVQEGNLGVGAGATVGKMLGFEHSMRGGLGSWSLLRPDGLQIGAIVAVSCIGDVVDPESGGIVAGARTPDGSGFADLRIQMRKDTFRPFVPLGNTVIGVVACNAALSKSQCTRVAQMAQDALARCIYPAHTPWDGDTIFAIATGVWQLESAPADPGLIGALAADVLSTAILRAVRKATSWGTHPACADLAKE
jgi:L-aminopeptidase/D-esterase-like protein